MVGSQISIGGTNWRVSGVMPERFHFPGNSEIWIVGGSNAIQALTGERPVGVLGPSVWIGRVRAGVSMSGAARAIELQARAEVREFPPTAPDGRNLVAGPGPHRSEVSAEAITALYGKHARDVLDLALAASVLILLVCIVSAAALGAVQAEARRPEIAVRLALGASTRRIFAHGCLAVLAPAVFGAGLALLVSAAALQTAKALLSNPSIPPAGFRLAPATLAVAAVTAAALACVPALLFVWKARSCNLASSLSQLGAQGRRVRPIGSWVIFAQAAITTALLAAALGAGLRLHAEASAVKGIDPSNIVVADLLLPAQPAPLPSPPEAVNARDRAILSRAEGRLSSVPGVSAVATTSCVPFDCAMGVSVWAARPGWRGTFVGERLVSSDYFAVLGTSMKRGAWGGAGAMGGIAVSESLARLLRRQGVAGVVGSTLVVEQHGYRDLRISAVVPDVQFQEFEPSDFPVIYLPLNTPLPLAIRGVSLIAKVNRRQGTVVALRSALSSVGYGTAVGSVLPLRAVLARPLQPARLDWGWLELAGATSAFLAWFGTYALVAFWTSGLMHEFAVRLALGATPARLAGNILQAPVRLAALGAVFGGAGWLIWGPDALLISAPALPRLSLVALSGTAVVLGSAAAAAAPAWRAVRLSAAGLLRNP